jgi:hypothetical protein
VKRIALAAYYVCATLEVNTVTICSTSSIRHFQFDFHSCLGAVSDTWPFITEAERARQAECLPESATVVSKPIYCDLVLYCHFLSINIQEVETYLIKTRDCQIKGSLDFLRFKSYSLDTVL